MPRSRGTAKRKTDLGQVAATVRAAKVKVDPAAVNDFRRKLVADFCKLLGDQLGGDRKFPTKAIESLPPRHRQTLERLLAGDGEKQIAQQLGISQHTVHQYVKALHKRFSVSSRGELLAKFIGS